MIEPQAVAHHEPWPELPWREWAPTIATLHMWTQIVGKVRMALAPPLNHWWHIPLYVTARGVTTSPIPYGHRNFQVDFDFLDHQLQVVDTAGASFTMALEPKSVAHFYREFMDGLHGLGIDVRIWTKPVEVVESIPFESDEKHASYDPEHAQLLWRGLLDADRVMKEFRTRFVGKASPVHFWWGGFDHAVTRFSGRPAPRHPGGAPNCATWVMEEAYSREVCSAGWWPRSEAPGPSLGEFMLPYDEVRRAADPDAAVNEFLQSTYEAGANLGAWDRAALEPAHVPDRPPTGPWSTRPR